MKAIAVFSMVFVVAMAFAMNVAGQTKGAIRVDFDPNVGWAIINTLPNGELIVTAHVQGGLPLEEFMVNLRVRYEDDTADQFVNIATLTTNDQGNGNVTVQVTVNPPEGSETLRRVAVRVRKPSPPNTLYLAVAWDVPLK